MSIAGSGSGTLPQADAFTPAQRAVLTESTTSLLDAQAQQFRSELENIRKQLADTQAVATAATAASTAAANTSAGSGQQATATLAQIPGLEESGDTELYLKFQ